MRRERFPANKDNGSLSKYAPKQKTYLRNRCAVRQILRLVIESDENNTKDASNNGRPSVKISDPAGVEDAELPLKERRAVHVT